MMGRRRSESESADHAWPTTAPQLKMSDICTFIPATWYAKSSLSN